MIGNVNSMKKIEIMLCAPKIRGVYIMNFDGVKNEKLKVQGKDEK